MPEAEPVPPSGFSYVNTAAWFIAGGAVTAVFSGSLVRLTTKVDWIEVLAVGMIVPCFTWVVQSAAAWFVMSSDRRQTYLADLGRICLYGSVALLPAGVANWAVSEPARWWSIVNVVASVAVMAAILFRLTARHGIARAWPASWCLTICINMGLFLFASRHWW